MVKKIRNYNNFNISSNYKNSIILIGNFDGVHIGHQKLFKLAKKYQKKFKLKIGVVTFEPVPKMYFNKKLKNFRISNLNQKKFLIQKLGVDFIITQKFDKNFSRIKYFSFIQNILYKKMKPKFIFVSNNFRLGNKREGNVKKLIQYEKNFGYKIIKPRPLIFKNKIVSSSFIRKLLLKGNLNYTNKLLRRKWSIESVVQKGRQVGKKIGFPTCNLDIKNYVIPRLGVYAVKIHRKNTNKILKGIANLGYRPTFNQKKILLEVHIFNFSSNLYNKVLTIDFISFIRNEKKFKNINQLRKQIVSDLARAKKKLN